MKITKRFWVIVGIVVLALVVIVAGVGLSRRYIRQAMITKTVAQVMAFPVRGQMVSISGKVSQVGEKNNFTIADATGEIAVVGGSLAQYRISLSPDQQVTVTGWIDLGTEAEPKVKPEVQLASLDVNGTVIQVAGGRGFDPRGMDGRPGFDPKDKKLGRKGGPGGSQGNPPGQAPGNGMNPRNPQKPGEPGNK